MINYDNEKNEVTITGCNDCPFFSINGFFLEFKCNLGVNLENYAFPVPEYFPSDCPLRDSNFKLTRVLGD